MNTKRKVGNRHKAYVTSDRTETIHGLHRLVDGRWRIVATGERFTEPDEAKAIDRFKRTVAKLTLTKVRIPQGEVIAPTSQAAKGHKDENGLLPTHPIQVVIDSDEQSLWDWFKEQLINRPAYVAERTGIPQLASFTDIPIKQSLAIAKVKATYQQFSPATARSKKQTFSALDRLVASTGAKTLDDLTTEKLLDFNKAIESDSGITSAGTRMAYYGRVKSVIAFGKKKGLNTATIDACLSRMSVLWTAEQIPAPQPKPISREDFHTLLEKGNGTWKGFLMLGLNLCMSMDEVCDLRWEHFDLKNGTYAALRGKTRRKRIPRAAVLWKDTIETLKQLPKRGNSPFVFCSPHGTRYNRNTKINDFREFADKLSLQHLTFNMIRDGAYTAACHGSPDERQARVLAGHEAGMSDSYVLRNPAFAKPACDAVHAKYFG